MKVYLEKIDVFVEKFEECVVITALLIAMFSLFINVILRTFFNYILSFPDELSRYLMIYIIYFGMSLGFKKNRQLSLDIVFEFFPKSKNVVGLIGSAISLFAMLTILYCGIKYNARLISNSNISSVLEIPLYLVYGVAPFAAVIMSFRLILQILDTFSKNQTNTGTNSGANK